MEIQKIFSSYDDYGYEDERLYSVLMTEEEMALFSAIGQEIKLARAAKKASKNAWVKEQGANFQRSMIKTLNPQASRNSKAVIITKTDLNRALNRFPISEKIVNDTLKRGGKVPNSYKDALKTKYGTVNDRINLNYLERHPETIKRDLGKLLEHL